MSMLSDAPLWSPGPATRSVAPEPASPTMLVVAAEPDVRHFAVQSFTLATAHTTGAALQQIAALRPTLLVVDLDNTSCDGYQVCKAAHDVATITTLVTTAKPERVPAALNAGCHAVLLKPFAPNLLAARVGRLMRERQQQIRMRTLRVGSTTADGTNRVWESITCPKCQTGGVTSFEFHSHRRMWFACLACSSVWLGPRQE
jgi:CheY-like chemotaxis protein